MHGAKLQQKKQMPVYYKSKNGNFCLHAKNTIIEYQQVSRKQCKKNFLKFF